MNAFRKLLTFFLAVGLAVSANAAPTKKFAWEISPFFFGGAGTPYTDVFPTNSSNLLKLTASFTNQSPGNSAFDSVRLILTQPGLQIFGVRTFSGEASLSPDKTVVSVANIPPVRAGDPAFIIEIYLIDPGCPADQVGTWDAFAWTGSNFTGDSFTDVSAAGRDITHVACDGTASCGDSLSPLVSAGAVDQPGHVEGFRGQFNDDGVSGSLCAAVRYDVTNTITSNSTVRVNWETDIDPNAVFLYKATWKLQISKKLRPEVAWIADTSGNPIFVAGQDCLKIGGEARLPAPYGILANAVTVDDSSLSVNTSSAVQAFPSVPFPIVIGSVSGNERMQVTRVTKITNTLYTLDVSRAQGGTPLVAHDAGASVVSTPLPLIAASSGPYIAGNQAQVCIADHSSKSVTDPVTGRQATQYFTTIIDVGDPWVRVGT
jgi:hypothetical protein